MIYYLITMCSATASLLCIIFAPASTATIVTLVLGCLWVGAMCVRTCLNFYAIDRTNDDIYDKDFTSLDDVPKPVVKIDEHC